MSVTFYWSRFPGRFVNKKTGKSHEQYVESLEAAGKLSGEISGPVFKGNVAEWYETLVETIIDVQNALHTQAIAELGPCNIDEVHVFVASQVQQLLEASVLWRPVQPQQDDEPATRLLATLAGLTVHYDRTTAEDVARVVAMFKCDDGSRLSLRGCVRVLDMPENGRRA